MTADEWDGCLRSDYMLLPLHEWLVENPQHSWNFERKLRLYAVACCRLRHKLFVADLFRRALDAAERLADHPDDREGLDALYDAIMDIPTPNPQRHLIENMTLKLIQQTGMDCALATVMDLGVATGWQDFEAIMTSQAPLVRCVVGNPFRPVAFEATWRALRVTELARTIYVDRTFELLPTLGDALEEAGCDHTAVLTHTRDEGPHARGCWVIDGLLGESG